MSLKRSVWIAWLVLVACEAEEAPPAEIHREEEVDAGSDSASDSRGVLGESCARRADCTRGLYCVANVCVESATRTEVMRTPLGERGESCQARNDCEAGLACIMNRCVAAESAIAVQAKQCFRVQ